MADTLAADGPPPKPGAIEVWMICAPVDEFPIMTWVCYGGVRAGHPSGH
jgi:hypothetical protein